MIGPLKECTLHHDATGKSKGIANVTFSRRGDASKAFNEYNNRLIDGSQYPFSTFLPSSPAPAQVVCVG